ncbi:hypothetical protein TOC8171_44220 [Pseudomonas syringae]
MNLIKRFWWMGLLLVFSVPVLADNVDYQTIAAASQKPNDLSRQAMVMIMGQVAVDPFAPSQPTLIGSLFAIINGVLAVMALFWFLTITLKTIVKAGHQGQFFAGGRSALYPIMTFAGFIMILPTQSGWSLAQLVMVWACSTMGVGSANLLTDKAVDMMDSGYSMVTQPTAPSTRSAARGIFEMNLCKYAINRELESLYADGVANTPLITTKGGNGQYDTGNGSAVCGSAKTPNTGRTGTWNLLFDSDVDTSGVITAQHQALDTMQSTLDQAAQAFVDTYLSKRDQDTGSFQDAETQIQNAAAAYENTVNLALNKIDFKDTLQSQLSSQIKSSGWVALGSWYHTFATANNKTNDVASSTPVVTGMSNLGEHGTGDLYNQVFAAYKSQVQNSTYTAPLGTQTTKDDGAAATANDPNAVFVGIFKSPMQKLTSLFATGKIGTDASFSNQVNPLIKMQTIGDYTLGTVETLMVAYAGTWAAASSASNSPLGWGAKIFSVDVGAVVKDVLGALAPMFYFVMFALLAIGFFAGRISACCALSVLDGGHIQLGRQCAGGLCGGLNVGCHAPGGRRGQGESQYLRLYLSDRHDAAAFVDGTGVLFCVGGRNRWGNDPESVIRLGAGQCQRGLDRGIVQDDRMADDLCPHCDLWCDSTLWPAGVLGGLRDLVPGRSRRRQPDGRHGR